MRYLTKAIVRDLRKKMVFVGGPRQSGKTTLARALLAGTRGVYLTWDDEQDRDALLARRWHPTDPLLVMDELHKFPRWKNWLKGIYDKKPAPQQILVTGSARLDIYRRGGDSLLGRYHYWRLHPFCLGELPVGIGPEEGLQRLLSVGGFPEPFVDADVEGARRWRRDRYARVLRDDIRDLEPLRNLATLELFVGALRRRVGSPVVLSNIAQDLQVSPKTLKHWLEVLERMYLVFVVRPYTHNLPRAVQKPPKVYFYDNMDVIGDDGARFENLVATHLLKRVHFYEDRHGFAYRLCYLRDKEGREVDFVIVKDDEVEALVEAKWADIRPAGALAYYRKCLLPRQTLQIVRTLERTFERDGTEIMSPERAFLEALPLAPLPAS